MVVVDPKETEDRARALSNKTGLIIVSDYNTGTKTTVGIGKQYMVALYPTETGNMVMHVNEICNQQPFMTLPIVNMTKRIYSCDLFTFKVFEQQQIGQPSLERRIYDARNAERSSSF